MLSAVLRSPARAEPAEIRARMDAMAAKRRESQPREASAGCVFRNPEHDKAGRLIDACGLKGHRSGAVVVSPAHANFIVNLGEARAADFITVMRNVRATVKESHCV